MGEGYHDIFPSEKCRYSHVSDGQLRTRVFLDDLGGLLSIRESLRRHHTSTMFISQELDAYLTQGRVLHLEPYVRELRLHTDNIECLEMSLSIELYNIYTDPEITRGLVRTIRSIPEFL